MTWKERFYSGLGEVLRSKGVDCIQVVDVYDYSVPMDGVMTEVTYWDRAGVECMYYYHGSLSELIDE